MLEIRSVVKRFPPAETPVLREVSLAIRPGEFFSLLGPSGCGKTTLLRILGGFEAPTSGQVHFEGRRIDVLPPNERHFNMVFQRYALFPHLSVRENVAFGLRMRRGPERVTESEIARRVDEMLSLVRLEGLGARSVTTLSGGQQQRVALARALINRPRVLLLDEPLSALDLKLRQQMQMELIGLQRKLQHTFVYVTHDQEEALTLSDRIAVMNEGRVEQVGTPREIYESPASEFVARFIGSTNSLDGVVIEAPERGTARFAWGDRTLLSAHWPKGLGASAPACLLIRPENLKIRAREPGSPIAALDAARANEVAGTLRQVLYQGAFTQLFVEPEGAPGVAPWIVSLPNRAGEAPTSLEPGRRVVLSWRPEECRIVPWARKPPARDGESPT